MGYLCDCSLPLTDKAGTVVANPDVAGIGVLVGLALPALATFVLLLVYYLSAVDADDLSMGAKLDISFLRWLHAKRPKWRSNKEELEKIILSFSDAQLVNALSLLLGAFTMGCSMDAYHWQIMLQCVWFTSATHLATIPILRAQLYRDNLGPGISRVSIYARAILMTLVLVMLVPSLVPTGHPRWLSNFDYAMTLPAFCFFDYDFDFRGERKRVTVFGGIWLSWSIGLATITFLKALFGLVTSPSKHNTLSNQPTLRDKLQSRIISVDGFMRRHPIIHFFWHSSRQTLRAIWRWLESFWGHIFWLFIMLSWNIYLVVYNKWLFQNYIEDGGDNKWGFGQTTPLVLLVLPAITIIQEHFAEKNNPEEGWRTMNFQLPQPASGNIYDDSTRITLFLIFEFLLIFALLAYSNSVSFVKEAASVSGTAFLFQFLAYLFVAPVVFTCIIHLADNIFEYMNLRKNTWRNGIIALVVALSIGAAITFFFMQGFYRA